MSSVLVKNRFLIARRSSQGLILFLFFAGSAYGWTVLRGNLSASKLMNIVPLADPFAVLQVFATGIIVRSETLAGAAIITLFFGLVAGRSFCSWICPVNIVTDAARWLRSRLGFGSDESTVRISRNGRYWALGLSIVISTVTGVAAFEWVSPISTLLRGVLFGMGAGWIVIPGLFLFDAAVAKDGFCGHICPLGGFYALITRFSLLRVRHDHEHCTRCMRCVEHCPERQVLHMVGKKTGAVSSGECTRCGRCIEVCDDRAMAFTIGTGAERN